MTVELFAGMCSPSQPILNLELNIDTAWRLAYGPAQGQVESEHSESSREVIHVYSLSSQDGLRQDSVIFRDGK